ncbi:MAG: hypothetical protein U0166_19835 [Acidobacteriota bacterium]
MSKNRAPAAVLAATFLLSASILELEISLTRVFSVMTWHHFTFLVISLALLGFGSSGTFLAVRRPARVARATHAQIFGAAAIAAFLLATRIQFEPLRIASDPTQTLSLVFEALILTVPFFFAGMCLASVIDTYKDDVHRVYFADLAGAGAGAISTVGLLEWIGAPSTIVLVGCLGSTAGVLLAWAEEGAGQGRRRLGFVALHVAVLVFFVLEDPYLVFAPSSKDIYPVCNAWKGHDEIAWSRWHVIARIDVSEPRALGEGQASPFPGGYRMVYQDGGAPTYILGSAGHPESMKLLSAPLQALAYKLRRPDKALVIGVGGGTDILIALHHGCRNVTGAEVNPLMIRAITRVFSDYDGHAFERPDVNLVVSEGRHFVSRTKETYDVIQLTGVDTFSALNLGAHALTENYVYTVEAIESFYGHLTEEGVLSFCRLYVSPPRETLRLCATMEQALERRGIQEPWRHLAVVLGGEYVETIVKAKPLTEEDMTRVRGFAQGPDRAVLFDPLAPRESELDRLLRTPAVGREALYDESPYDIRPTTDDNPFFFDYYRWRNLIASPAPSAGGYVVSAAPIGLLTLVWSLVLVFLLASIGILVPMRRHAALGSRGPSVIAYFGALGLGFIFVEVTLIQRLMPFLGGPAYSLSFTLFAILLSSGLGSFYGKRLDASRRQLGILGALLAAAIIAIGPLLAFVLPRWLGLSWGGRAGLALLIVAPVAFLMGMPFPMGIRVLSRTVPEGIPWAWSINSFMSVLGPLLSVFLSMHLGFRAVFLVAAGVYGAGFLAYAPLASRTGIGAPQSSS